MPKLTIIKKELRYPCFVCRKSPRGEVVKQSQCPACGGDSLFKDEIYYHIVEKKNHQKIAFDADTLK